MKRFEQFSTPEELEEAYYIFCAERVDRCIRCVLGSVDVNCRISWLFLDENERLSPEDHPQIRSLQKEFNDYRREADWHDTLYFFEWYCDRTDESVKSEDVPNEKN